MTEKLNRRDRERQRHRQEILDAAERIFAAKGYYGCTIEDIAAEAEFSVGTLYNFFPSKEDLYRSLLTLRIDQMLDEIKALPSNLDDPVQALHEYTANKAAICEKYHAFFKLYFLERMGDRYQGDSPYYELIEPLCILIRDMLIDIFQAGIDQGVFKDDHSSEDLAIAYEGLTDGMMFEWLDPRTDCNFAEKVGMMWTVFCQGVVKKP